MCNIYSIKIVLFIHVTIKRIKNILVSFGVCYCSKESLVWNKNDVQKEKGETGVFKRKKRVGGVLVSHFMSAA